MELKGRLKLIADKIPPCETVCDVGTDHAYIPLYLILNNRCSHAIAADVGEGPLNAAKENIKQYKLDKKIETRLGDGLEPLDDREADVIIIAGMGGGLIRDILNRGFSKAKNAKLLVLQPMNAVEELREWLYQNGFVIEDEELTCEGEKIYNVILAKWTGNNTNYSLIDLYVGKKLTEKKDPLLVKFLQRKIRQTQQVLEELRNTSTDKADIVRKHEYLANQYDQILCKLKNL